MKKTIVNFQTPLYIMLFFVFFLMTACQKEEIELVTPTATATETTTEIHELDLSNLNNKLNSNARADSWMVMNELIEVTNGEYWITNLNIEDLPDPNTHRLDVTIIPFGKPTDLVLKSFDPNRAPTAVVLKESRNPAMQVDFLKFRQNDFIHGEIRAMIQVEWEGQGNKFELKVNAVPVDCEEDAPRRLGDVGIEFQPVCGCDGNTYFDATAAYNAGVTSYKRGRCLPNLNIPVDGLWQSIDPEIVQHLVRIEDNCIELTIVDIDEHGNDNSATYLFCDEDETKEGEERTWTVVDKSKKSFFIWPVERWSAQVNKEGELEIYRTDGADKDKDQKDKDGPKTILHRYKRIK